MVCLSLRLYYFYIFEHGILLKARNHEKKRAFNIRLYVYLTGSQAMFNISLGVDSDALVYVSELLS